MNLHSFRISPCDSRLGYIVSYLLSGMLSILEGVVLNLSHIWSMTNQHKHDSQKMNNYTDTTHKKISQMHYHDKHATSYVTLRQTFTTMPPM